MIYKKIILKPKSWLISKLESDTILSYIFAYNFEKLTDIYKKFQNWQELPFLITNWFLENTLPRPIYFTNSNNADESKKTTLFEDIKNEPDKKKIKKLWNISLNKNILEMIFTWKEEELREQLRIYSKNNESKKINETVWEYKNNIALFNIWETKPFEIENIDYITWNYVIYVKIFDEKDFNIFFDCLKNTFEKIGFWKGKSRWYGHFKNVENFDLDENEKEVFEYLDELKKQNLYLVLNNYKPKTEEIENFDLEKSFYQINTKHTKSLNEFNENIFKWQMNFINNWSVIKSQKNLIWDNYKSWNSYNFWYIF